MAKKSNPKSANGIVSIDAYAQESYILSKNELVQCVPHKVSKSNFFISYLKYKDVMVGSIEIPAVNDDTELPDLITIRVYEEFSLDSASEYKITYKEVENHGADSRIFNVFVIKTDVINKNFSNITKKVPYIDYIVAAPMVFDGLYTRNFLSSEQTHAFIVLQEDDAFVSVYQNGEYLQSRPLRYSIKNIYDKFLMLNEEPIDRDEFDRILDGGGSERDQENIEQIFYEIAYYINDTITSLNRIYDIKIEELHLVKSLDLNKLYQFIQKITMVPTINFEPKISVNQNASNVDPFITLMTIFGQSYKDIQDDSFNFSPFLRPPPLSKRHSGKLMSYALLGFLLAFAYPAYQYIYSFIVQQDINRLTDEYNVAHQIEENIKNEHARLAEETKIVKAEVDVENERINFRKKLLTEIHDKKVNYPMKSIVLYELTNLISEKDIKVGQILNNDKNMTIMLVSPNEKQLTEFIKNVSNEMKYSITTREILLNKTKKAQMYESNVTIEINQ